MAIGEVVLWYHEFLTYSVRWLSRSLHRLYRYKETVPEGRQLILIYMANRQTLSLVVATEDRVFLKLIPSIHVSPNTLSSLHPLQIWLPWWVQKIPDALIIFIQSLKWHHWQNEDQHAPSAASSRPLKATDTRKSTLRRTQKTVPNGAGNTLHFPCVFSSAGG